MTALCKLTDRQLSDRAATLCGWRRQADNSWRDPGGHTRQSPPCYARDLDAVHQLELQYFVNADDVVLHRHYLRHLDAVCAPQGVVNQWLTISATARQRTTAFVLTMEQQGVS